MPEPDLMVSQSSTTDRTTQSTKHATEHATEHITEQNPDWNTQEVFVDPENRLVKNVALTGQVSSNGYRYSEQALLEGLPLYEQKPVFLDHALARTSPHQRSTRDLVGTIVNVRYEAGRIRGDIRVLDTEAGRTFLALTESNAPSVGMSHVVLAEKNADGSVVEKIHDVVSVDAVVFPATTKSFYEQTSQRDLLEQQIQHLTQQRNTLQSQCEVERLLDQSQLPPQAVTDQFRQQLLQAESREARLSLIEERMGLVQFLMHKATHPSSQERLREGLIDQLTDEQIINAIRHRTGQ